MPFRTCIRFTLLFISIFLCSHPVLGKATLTIAVGDGPPYIFEENGSVNKSRPGFMVEIVQLALSHTNYKAVFVAAPFSRRIKGTETGAFDAAIGLFKSDSDLLIYPEESIGMGQSCFFSKSRSKWQYDGVDSLKSVVLGVTNAYTYGDIDDYITGNAQKIVTVSGNNSVPRLLRLLRKGRIDVFVEDKFIGMYFVRSQKIEDVKEAGCIDGKEVYVGFSPKLHDVPSLSKQFTQNIKKLRESGRLNDILASYYVLDWE